MKNTFILLALLLLSVTLPGQSTGCVFQGSLYSDSSEVIIGLPFVQWVKDNGTGCQLAVQYATQTGNQFPVKPRTIVRLRDTYSSIISQGGSGLVQFNQNTIDFAINRDWVEAVYESVSGNAIIIVRDGRTRFLTDETYSVIRSRFIVCPDGGTANGLSRIYAENGLYTPNDSTVRLGGTLLENTTVSTLGYNLTMGKLSGTSKSYLSVYGGGTYSGIYSNSPTAEVDLAVGNGLFGFEQNDASNASHLVGDKFGIVMDYSGTYGTAIFSFDSAQFRMTGLQEFTTHADAETALTTDKLYKLSGDRSIYINSGSSSITPPDYNTESYNSVTSTTSPVTLSSTKSDNLINQGSTQATFTLKFPASPNDGQVLTITYANAISTLTLDGNGNTIVGSAVTTAVPGSQRKFKFYSGVGWIKIY